jgi:uroporphyrinogen-III synthase
MTAAARARDWLVLVTRPGEAGQHLTGALREAGQRALWWPTFDLLPPDEPEALRALLRRLAEFDLVVFVSPAAVRGLVRQDPGNGWPAGTAIAAAGASTLALARSLLPGAAAARIAGLANGAKQSGSEALWEALQTEAKAPRRALIVRAESGREWLADRLREAGCSVEYASVYRRVVHQPAQAQAAALAACHGAGDCAASVLTSSESVGALDRQLEALPEARAWLRQGLALCSHARVARAVQDAGYSRVIECAPSVDSVLEAMAEARQAEARAQ